MCKPSWVESSPLKNIELRQISTNQGLSNSNVNGFYQDKQGFIWIATEAGLNRFDGTSVIQIQNTKYLDKLASINSLTYDSQDNLWVSTTKGLSFINPSKSIQHFSQFPSIDSHQSQANMVVGSVEKSLGSMWVFNS